MKRSRHVALPRRSALGLIGAAAVAPGLPGKALAGHTGDLALCRRASQVVSDRVIGAVAARAAPLALSPDVMADLARRDYRAGRTLRIDGLVVAETEAALLALLGRSAEGQPVLGDRRHLLGAILTDAGA